jgi:hypothetical protein
LKGKKERERESGLCSRPEVPCLRDLPGPSHRHSLRAVVEEALVDEREQRVEDGAVGLEDLVDEGDLWCGMEKAGVRTRTPLLKKTQLSQLSSIFFSFSFILLLLALPCSAALLFPPPFPPPSHFSESSSFLSPRLQAGTHGSGECTCPPQGPAWRGGRTAPAWGSAVMGRGGCQGRVGSEEAGRKPAMQVPHTNPQRPLSPHHLLKPCPLWNPCPLSTPALLNTLPAPFCMLPTSGTENLVSRRSK